MVRAGLGYLAAADAAQLGAAAQAECPTAAPRVMPVRWISQDTALESPSPAWPCPAVNAARNPARAAVAIASCCSSSRRHSA